MKKIPFMKMAFIAMIAGIFASCAGQKAVLNSDTTKKSSQTNYAFDPNRNKADVPNKENVLTMRPDSQKVETKEETCFFILAKNCLYVTVHRKLFEKIVGWLPEIITNSKNCVVLDGTLIDPFTLITQDELKSNPALEKLIQLNGYKVYAIFNYGNYPNGLPQNYAPLISNSNDGQSLQQQGQPPASPSNGNGRTIYRH